MFMVSLLSPLILLYYAFILGFFVGAPIIGFAYIRPEADRSGSPGWLWALSTVFLSWIAVLAFLIVRWLTAYQPRR